MMPTRRCEVKGNYIKTVQFPLAFPGPNGNSVITVTGEGKTRDEAEYVFEVRRQDMIRALEGKPANP